MEAEGPVSDDNKDLSGPSRRAVSTSTLPLIGAVLTSSATNAVCER